VLRGGGGFLVAVMTAALTAACGGGGEPAGGAAGGAPPPTGVKTITLAERPITEASEFVGTVQSLGSTTIQPQAEGRITRIVVKSGDRVKAGALLAQIDPDKQQAAGATLEASRAGREADVAYARQQLDRAKTLFEAGAVSRQELDQAETLFKTATAQLEALNAQIREWKVELSYYRLTAPTDGVVGDIPVRVGDRVTTSTVVTTIDQNRGLEAHVQVPVEQATRLQRGLPMEILDGAGKPIVRGTVSFIAPRAEDATQSVLVKSVIPPGTPVRVLQYVRARLVWSTAPGLAVPIVAVTRVTGAYFCFVAEPKDQGFVARQRAIQVGDVVGDDYVVRSGLKAGDRVIVSGIQKLGDGVPVQPEG
jgi:RND family efflux transporter MFP subunit